MKYNPPAIFRVWNDGGEIYAIFPDQLADLNGNLECWTPMGHTAANYQVCLRSSRLAKPEEYAVVKATIERQYGYELRAVKRQSRKMHDAVQRELHELIVFEAKLKPIEEALKRIDKAMSNVSQAHPLDPDGGAKGEAP